MEKDSKIILLTDAREMKRRQQKELALTELAIKIIEKETTANTVDIK